MLSGCLRGEKCNRYSCFCPISRPSEPAPSPTLRTAAADAVNEVMVTELCRRLDAIAEIARELGGAVGVQIRELASPGTIEPPRFAKTPHERCGFDSARTGRRRRGATARDVSPVSGRAASNEVDGERLQVLSVR